MKIAFLILSFTIIEIKAQIEVPEVANRVVFNGSEEDNKDNVNNPYNFTVVSEFHEDLPVLDNSLEETHSNLPEPSEEEASSRKAAADPTLHKWKHKRPFLHSHAHTHIHTVTHGKGYEYGTPGIHPVSVNSQYSHQSIKYPITTGGHLQTSSNSNHWNTGYQQNAHSTLHQGSHTISQQNAQTFNHNNNYGSFGNPPHSSLSSMPSIVNMNGQTNTLIHSGNTQTLFTSNNAQSLAKGNRASSIPQNDPLIGISIPVEEAIYWHQTPPKTPGNINPAVYDSEMNQILNILDERSYYQERPEVETHNNRKNAETTHWNEFDEGSPDEELEQETKAEADVDFNLKSPFIIQVPSNNFFHSYGYERRRERRSPKDINLKLLSDNSMLFNITSWKLEQVNSKIDDTLRDYRNVVDEYRNKLTDKRETIFADILDSLIGQYRGKNDEISNEVKKIQKRSATITKLLNNPDVKLDVPKTLDNIGVITRNAFEDERSPMYHVRQFIGSTKNAVLSAMKIPPQNLMIPSNYEIKNINPEEITYEEDNLVSGVNPKILTRSGFRSSESSEDPNPYAGDPYGIVETFARVGGAIRDSVRSSQNTLNHISNIAHDARKIFHTTKNTVPRVLLPYAKAPVLTSRFKETKKAPIKKAIIISPKVLDVKDSTAENQVSDPEFVSMGHILDAIGLTKPSKSQIDLEKIVVKMPGKGETRGFYIPPIGEVKSVNGKKLPNLKGNADIKRRAKEQLGLMQEKVASTSRSVKNNIEKLKSDLSMTLDKTKNKVKSDLLQMKERNNVDVILSQSRIQNVTTNSEKSKAGIKHFTKEEENEIIDKFLHNIFEIDPESPSGPIASRSKIETTEKNITPIENKKEGKKRYGTLLGLSNDYIPPDISRRELEEAIKNITLDILEEENNNKNLIIKNSTPNKIKKEDFIKKPRRNHRKTPRILLQSRFGEDEDSTTTTTTEEYNHTTLEPKDVDNKDEEAMRKVDEYVFNDVFNPSVSEVEKNGNEKSSWKIGDLLELIEDHSAEESSNELGDGKELGQMPKFSSRNLLRNLGTKDELKTVEENDSFLRRKRSTDNEEEKVGLNLPPALMTPFMARVSNPNLDKVFKDTDEQKEEDSSATEDEDDKKLNNGEEMLGLSLPPELTEPMERASNDDINKAFTSNENEEQNVLNDNDEMRYYSPLLLMPQRTAKSVKKTLDEFLKKENETREVLNTQENRLKVSTDQERLRNVEGIATEKIYIPPPHHNMHGLARRLKQNNQMKNPGIIQENDQNLHVCVCISEDSDSYENQLSGFEAGDRKTGSYASNGVGQSRTSMGVSENLRKPFMGLGNDESIKKFYEEYNNENVGEEDLFHSEEEKLLFSDDLED